MDEFEINNHVANVPRYISHDLSYSSTLGLHSNLRPIRLITVEIKRTVMDQEEGFLNKIPVGSRRNRPLKNPVTVYEI
jgi:hypothetical protein